jgi:GTPase SAR1 family protein
VYDVSDKKSFENAKNSWLVELQETADDESTLKQCTMLVGNKTDLTPVVNEAEHMASVKSLGLSLSVRIEIEKKEKKRKSKLEHEGNNNFVWFKSLLFRPVLLPKLVMV